MRRKSSVLTAAAAAAFVGLTTTSAAALPLTITPLGPVTFTNAGPVQVLDLTTGAGIVCDTSVLRGNVTSSGLSVHAASFSGQSNPNGWCTGPVSILMQVTATGLPWTFNPISYSSGVTLGNFSGVGLTLHGSDECDATVGGPGGSAGTIEATYTNATSLLTIAGGNLEVQTADADCDPSLINAGDQIDLSGSYVSDPPLTMGP